MKKKEISNFRAGDELYYVFNRLGYRYRRVIFRRHYTTDYYLVEENGRTVNVCVLYLFKTEDEAREYAAKSTRSLIFARLRELEHYFSSLKDLGEDYLNEEILRDIKVKIVKDFYTIKDKKQ